MVIITSIEPEERYTNPATGIIGSITVEHELGLNSKSNFSDIPPAASTKRGKSKLAPRSSLQFKVGPPFTCTKKCEQLYVSSTNTPIDPTLVARIDRGFDFIENEWVGYKRNYFTLVGCFQFNCDGERLLNRNKLHILDHGVPKNVEWFSLEMAARCNEDGADIPLVQHTAKRDRGPQTLPTVRPAVPGKLPSHEIVRRAANIRNDQKINSLNQLFYYHLPLGPQAPSNSILSTYPVDCLPEKVAKFERIQFSSIDLNKRTIMANKHSILEVKLFANFEDGERMLLAYTESPPLVVRGRSPSNYHLARKELMAKQRETALHNQKSQAGAKIGVLQKVSTNVFDNIEGQTLEELMQYSNQPLLISHTGKLDIDAESSAKGSENLDSHIDKKKKKASRKKPPKASTVKLKEAPNIELDQLFKKDQHGICPEFRGGIDSPLSVLSLDGIGDKIPSVFLIGESSAKQTTKQNKALSKAESGSSKKWRGKKRLNVETNQLNLPKSYSEGNADREFQEFRAEMQKIRFQLYGNLSL